jgi:pyrimidine-specific ribonucleoside hydrolase
MHKLTRRSALKSLAALAAGAALPGRLTAAAAGMRPELRFPLVHLTDLYHPPQDPDDHIDLATIIALPEYDLRGVVLDITRKFLVAKPEGWDIARDPGYVPVAQLAHLTGRAIPAAMGPLDPLVNPGDTAQDRPRPEQGGINLLLELLEQSVQPVTISVVGSGRVLAAAFNREPVLLKAKIRRVLLNAGATGGPKREWNVGLDPAAYIALWRSGLPINWFPCGTDRSAFDPAHERGTFWKARHAVLFHDLPEGLRAWLGYAFTGSRRGDSIGALAETGRGAAWEQVLTGERNLWATASLVMGAERVLARTPEGWRFVPAGPAAGLEPWPFRLDPIQATIDDEARVSWQSADDTSLIRLFGRKPGAEYGAAMAEALNALLRGMGEA